MYFRISGLNNAQLKKIQTIQYACRRIITGFRKYDSVTHLLHLRWLPVKFRISSKLAVCGHKIIYDKSFPQYLINEVRVKKRQRFTCASLRTSFSTPLYNLSTVGGKSTLIYSVGITQNGLPDKIEEITSLSVLKCCHL